jgi:hypothetical protein
MVRPALPLLIPCALLAAAAAAAVCVYHTRPADPPALSTAEALDRARALGLRAVPDGPGDGPVIGYWLLAPGADDSPERLRDLVRQGGRAGDWKGVVLMKPEAHPDDTLGRQLAEWGDAGLYVRPLVFFGDPAMVARVADALGAPHPKGVSGPTPTQG